MVSKAVLIKLWCLSWPDILEGSSTSRTISKYKEASRIFCQFARRNSLKVLSSSLVTSPGKPGKRLQGYITLHKMQKERTQIQELPAIQQIRIRNYSAENTGQKLQ